jgi:hypothetical protein
LLVLSLLAPLVAAPPVRAGAAEGPDKPEDPVVAAPAVHSRLQPRLCRDLRRPELALLDQLPDGAGAPAGPELGRALDVLAVFEQLAVEDPRRLVLLSLGAEFSVEQQRHFRGRRRELQEQRCRAEDRGDEAQAARLLTQQLELERRELRWRRQAIELYRQIVTGPQTGAAAPGEQRALVALHERALIELACLLALDHRGAEARAAAEQLLKEHPQSRFVPYAHLVLAESLFDRGTAAR